MHSLTDVDTCLTTIALNCKKQSELNICFLSDYINTSVNNYLLTQSSRIFNHVPNAVSHFTK